MIYAIGDVHGSLHLLEALLVRIKEDATNLGIKRPSVILMGDTLIGGSADEMYCRCVAA